MRKSFGLKAGVLILCSLYFHVSLHSKEATNKSISVALWRDDGKEIPKDILESLGTVKRERYYTATQIHFVELIANPQKPRETNPCVKFQQKHPSIHCEVTKEPTLKKNSSHEKTPSQPPPETKKNGPCEIIRARPKELFDEAYSQDFQKGLSRDWSYAYSGLDLSKEDALSKEEIKNIDIHIIDDFKKREDPKIVTHGENVKGVLELALPPQAPAIQTISYNSDSKLSYTEQICAWVDERLKAEAYPSVVNLSFGVDEASIHCLNKLAEKNTIFSLASGNEWPKPVEKAELKLKNRIYVGSASPMGLPSVYSQSHETLNFLFPSDVLVESEIKQSPTKKTHQLFSGTSGAAPQASALVGMLKAKSPELSFDAILKLLNLSSIKTLSASANTQINGRGIPSAPLALALLDEIKKNCSKTQQANCVNNFILKPNFNEDHVAKFSETKPPLDRNLIYTHFPSCDTKSSTPNQTSSSSCSEKQRAFKDLRNYVFLHPQDSSAWNLVSCIYKNEGFTTDAAYYATLPAGKDDIASTLSQIQKLDSSQMHQGSIARSLPAFGLNRSMSASIPDPLKKLTTSHEFPDYLKHNVKTSSADNYISEVLSASPMEFLAANSPQLNTDELIAIASKHLSGREFLDFLETQKIKTIPEKQLNEFLQSENLNQKMIAAEFLLKNPKENDATLNKIFADHWKEFAKDPNINRHSFNDLVTYIYSNKALNEKIKFLDELSQHLVQSPEDVANHYYFISCDVLGADTIRPDSKKLEPITEHFINQQNTSRTVQMFFSRLNSEKNTQHLVNKYFASITKNKTDIAGVLPEAANDLLNPHFALASENRVKEYGYMLDLFIKENNPQKLVALTQRGFISNQAYEPWMKKIIAQVSGAEAYAIAQTIVESSQFVGDQASRIDKHLSTLSKKLSPEQKSQLLGILPDSSYKARIKKALSKI